MALAFLLLFIAFPRLMAAWWALPGNPHRLAVLTGRIQGEALEIFLESRKRALRWTPHHGQLWQELALAQLARAKEAPEAWPAAKEALIQALRHRPADGLGWLTLAKISHREAHAEQALRALRLSLWTAPHDPALFWPRLYLIAELGEAAQKLLEE